MTQVTLGGLCPGPGAERHLRTAVRRLRSPGAGLGARRRRRPPSSAPTGGSQRALAGAASVRGAAHPLRPGAPSGRRCPLTRRAVFARDGGRCVYCDAPATSLDHVVPRSRGGEHVWDNVVSACRRCNHLKADRSVADLGWRMRHAPFRRSGRPGASWGGRAEAAWVPYLVNTPAVGRRLRSDRPRAVGAACLKAHLRESRALIGYRDAMSTLEILGWFVLLPLRSSPSSPCWFTPRRG